MPSLLDIAPLTEQVTVRGVSLSVRGVSALGVASLIQRFPEVQDLMGGKELSAESLFKFGGAVVAAIIACGLGSPGSSEHEESAAGLSIEEQLDLLDAILRLSLPRGIGPFVEKLTRVGKTLSGEAGREAATKAPGTT